MKQPKLTALQPVHLHTVLQVVHDDTLFSLIFSEWQDFPMMSDCSGSPKCHILIQDRLSLSKLLLHIFQKTSFLWWLAALQAALPVAVAVFWCVHFTVKRLAVNRIEIRKIDRQAIQRFVLRTFLQQSSDLIRPESICVRRCTALLHIQIKRR